MKKLALFVMALSSINSYACINIRTAPARISHPGSYCLASDLKVLNPASIGITIAADNVTLDFQNHALIFSAGESRASGVESNGHSNITVKNGIIRKFMYGIRIQDVDLNKLKNNSPDAMHNIQVSNMQLENNTFRGVSIQARNSSVTNSKVYSTGGTTVFQNSYAIGIEMAGNYCNASGNVIDGVYPVGTGEGVGLSVSTYGDGCQVFGNKISLKTKPPLARSFGIWFGPVEKIIAIVSGNTISDASYSGNFEKAKIESYDNFIANISCAPWYGKGRSYYIDRKPCAEEDTESITALALNGNRDFLYKLGMQYFKGMWVDADLSKARYYYTLAAKLGHEEAARLLKII